MRAHMHAAELAGDHAPQAGNKQSHYAKAAMSAAVPKSAHGAKAKAGGSVHYPGTYLDSTRDNNQVGWGCTYVRTYVRT